MILPAPPTPPPYNGSGPTRRTAGIIRTPNRRIRTYRSSRWRFKTRPSKCSHSLKSISLLWICSRFTGKTNSGGKTRSDTRYRSTTVSSKCHARPTNRARALFGLYTQTRATCLRTVAICAGKSVSKTTKKTPRRSVNTAKAAVITISTTGARTIPRVRRPCYTAAVEVAEAASTSSAVNTNSAAITINSII